MKKEEEQTTWKQQTIDKDTFDNNLLKAMDEISPCGNFFPVDIIHLWLYDRSCVICNYWKRWLSYFADNTE